MGNDTVPLADCYTLEFSEAINVIGNATRITDDEYDDQRPRVNTFGLIVWQKWDGSDYEFYACY